MSPPHARARKWRRLRPLLITSMRRISMPRLLPGPAQQRSLPLVFLSGAVIGVAGGMIGLGGTEFRLPLLIGVFGFAALKPGVPGGVHLRAMRRVGVPEGRPRMANDSEETTPETTPETASIKDTVGNVLADGDTVTVAKDLKVKGAGGGVVKVGTKVRGIRLIEDGAGDHDIDATVPGFGRMQLKSNVVKKVV